MVEAPSLWFKTLSKALIDEGFIASKNDPCLFLHPTKKIIILVYVDDCLIFGKEMSVLNDIVKTLRSKHPLTDDDIGNDVYDYLGIEVTMNDGKITLFQTGLINKILETTGYNTLSTTVKTPAKEVPLDLDANGKPFDGNYDYASVVGMCLYVVNTRPDIQFAVHSCCRFVHSPHKSHDNAIKRLCRYLIATKDKGLTFHTGEFPLQLQCYVDADFCGLHKYEEHYHPVSPKSRTGYVIFLGKSPISWCSKLQTETALSSTESEIVALSTCMRKILWIQRLIQDISFGFGVKVHDETLIKATVHEDNQAAISNANKTSINNRTRHIHTKYWHFREHLNQQTGIVIQYIKSADNIGDLFTKGVSAEFFVPLCELLMGW